MDDFDEEFSGETPADPRDPGETFLPRDAVYRHDMGGSHRERFAGLPVPYDIRPVADPGRVAWALCDETEIGHDAPGSALPDGLDKLLRTVNGAEVQALVITGFGATNAPRLLAEHADHLPALRSVFLGFVEPEHWEISWIRQGDITPLLEAYPRLERLDVRGSEGLTMRPVTHRHLKVLRFETGGLPGEVVRAVGASALPSLQHLELWLGIDQYGGDSTVADLDGILSGAGLPALKRLGLRDSPIQDDIAAAVAAAPVVARLEELSLGMGTLTDRGAEALLSGQPLSHLRALDLRHHFLSETLAARLRRGLPGVAVDLEDAQPRGDDWLYVAVSE
ncbi:leucine-rich repeat domain-containing protein [Nonomuraea terrae]|uniref:Leucine-rich repeat domain-containing protein n=1 Tax=Nonomuraea terrae TaxID=2530383 RepID=A0A4R4XKJ5_9ACTN|nr:STM4015 family protein [Nonomuraea terrae]TDD31424.1 leucine-rich repeat domain-containing protein [Nonomuraea terrae]